MRWTKSQKWEIRWTHAYKLGTRTQQKGGKIHWKSWWDEQIKITKYQKGKNKEKWNEHMLTTLKHELNPRNGIKITSFDVKWKEQNRRKMK